MHIKKSKIAAIKNCYSKSLTTVYVFAANGKLNIPD